MVKRFFRHRIVHTHWPLAAVLLLGFGVGWVAHSSAFFGDTQMYRGTILRDDDNEYPLVSPLLSCDVGPEDAFPEFEPIKNSLISLIAEQKHSGATTDTSVYVRSLKTGRWFEINGSQTYAPASMLKVFVMMAYYQEAQDNPAVLGRQLAFEVSVHSLEDTPGAVIPHLVAGNYYSVSKLIRQMIVYSDNDALNTLVDNFDAQTLAAFNGIFVDLNIPSPAAQTEHSLDFMSVSEYSMIYRVLFGATYLSAAASNDALRLLSEAQYQEGIVAGVPQGTTVAHKFGVRHVPTSPAMASAELHDCGIVYYPNHPYLLCVMTRGKDFGHLQQALQDISHIAYLGLDAFYKNLPSSKATPTIPTKAQ